MKLNKCLLATVLVVAPIFAFADYRAEIGAELGITKVETDYERDLQGDVEQDVTTKYSQVQAVVYLTPVVTGKDPLAEAAFVGKNSSVGITSSRDSVEVENDNYFSDFDYDDDIKTLRGHFVVPAGIDLIFDLGAGRGDFDETDIDTRSLGVGAYITPTSSVTLEYTKEDHDTDGFEFDYKYWTLASHNLLPLREFLGLAFEPRLTVYDYDNDTDLTELGLKAVLYVNRQLGMYLDIVASILENNDETDEESVRALSRIGVDYFVNEQVRVGAALISVSGASEYYLPTSGDVDTETTGHGIEVNAAVRF